ncbi:MAG: hypothetical protein GX620_17460 [Chloroflexi bacterium]|nr:hypothetical protein [Chloroflexota bacterium]
MRKTALAMASLLLVLVVGCSANKVASTETVAPPSPTSAPDVATPTPFVTSMPAAPATCRVAPIEFPKIEGIPEIHEGDHIEGNINGSIVLIEYADFQ